MATSFPLQATATDISGTITTGGTAQSLNGGTTPPHGFWLYNADSTNDLWFSTSGTAAIGSNGSVRIGSYQMYESPVGAFIDGALSITGSTTGQKFTGKVF